MSKSSSPAKFTMWTASASSEVPLLAHLDMRAPLIGARSAKKRAASAKAKEKAALAFYAPRSLAESLRKLVK